MTRKLVIHVGAQKCASSSLQASLRLVAQASKGGLGFCFLNPEKLRDADQALKKNSKTAFHYVDLVLSGQSSSKVVVSHEMLGNRPALVCSIAERALEKHSFDHVVVSGYSRLQSNYHVSAFSQWFFRDRKKLLSDLKVLSKYNLNWRQFTALERSLLALSLVGKDRNWHSNYRRFCDGVKSLGDSVTVVSCHIPTRSNPYSLLEHFLSSTGIPLELEELESFDVRKNLSFHPVLIHGMSAYLSSLRPLQQSFFPHPHEGNRWLFRVCKRLSAGQDLMAEFDSLFSPRLQNSLIGHLDCRASSSNKQYCELMSVDFSYFQPSDEASLLLEEELLDLARDTEQSRNAEDIGHFDRRIQNACMQSMRAEIVSS
ncbi:MULTISPECIES: hypothetical protein [unclassified Synechococcus]|uniref:hypothetical protein n=1 Tax=unclassified Synechococcus TaxID=2626047 RepID=UPI001CF91F72|nr:MULTISPECIES: hypothetical protein [unclassified Synechococcus]MCB4377388.1 hypothetical protein [Synechococcus sp. MU1650]MCB4412411.1 hypothetical protein [Synechococcus sp. MU1611]